MTSSWAVSESKARSKMSRAALLAVCRPSSSDPSAEMKAAVPPSTAMVDRRAHDTVGASETTTDA